jgi:Tfp pilus assembly protein PilF
MATAGCASAPVARAPGALVARTPAELVAEARAEGLAAEDPLEIDAEMKAEVERVVGRMGTPEERLKRLFRFLNDRMFVGFQYASNRSLTARDAYRQRSGDCVAYTHLFVSLARHLGVPVYFVYVREVEGHYERGGAHYLSSHVAIGYGHGPMAMVMDLAKQAPDWSLSLYNAIDDGTALALYQNNLAVDAMMAGELDRAEHALRFWRARRPNAVELHNNLGVLLNRRGRYAEALAVLEEGIASFPKYLPLYTNAIVAARAAGQQKVAIALVRRSQAVGDEDPLLLLVSAMSLYQEGDSTGAAERLERAGEMLPESAVIAAWLARVYLGAGRKQEGERAFERVRKLEPGGRLERDLRREFPLLQGM